MNQDSPPPTLFENLRQRLRALIRPGSIGDTAHGIFRRWFRKVWESRGGGLYALGFALTFGYLEIVELITDDIPTLFSINILGNELFSFLVQFVVDTFKNMLQAFLWPVGLIQWQWPMGILLLAAGYLLFPRLVQRPLEHWIFEGQVPPSRKGTKEQERENDGAGP